MTREERQRLERWTTSNGCPSDCDRTYAGSGHQGGWSSDHNGACRHGVYVGGSGIDWMCGTCEDMSLDEELASDEIDREGSVLVGDGLF